MPARDKKNTLQSPTGDRCISAIAPARGASFPLQQIPLVAAQIAEYDDLAVVLVARRLDEFDAARLHVGELGVEIVGVEKQEHASAGLVADLRQLLGADG